MNTRRLLIVLAVPLALAACGPVLGFLDKTGAAIEEIAPTPRSKYAHAALGFETAITAINRLDEEAIITPAQMEMLAPIVAAGKTALLAWHNALLKAGEARDAGLVNRAADLEIAAISNQPQVLQSTKLLAGVVERADRPLLTGDAE